VEFVILSMELADVIMVGKVKIVAENQLQFVLIIVVKTEYAKKEILANVI
jgi:hypothetical protein